MLNAGSSRVFNCVEIYHRLCSKEAADPSFFKHAPFHKMVVIKEAASGRDSLALGRRLVTKLYFPYNSEDIYEGGRSILLHDPKVIEVLNELVGLQSPKLAKDVVRSDLKVLQVLDGLPSLDAFLMRDALELEGLSPNPLYMEVSESERQEIFDFIRRKFEPLVRTAVGQDAFQDGKVRVLVDKIWEARDLDALEPLIQACRFPKGEALKIFTAWKGVNFYAFQYERSKDGIETLERWLGDIVMPRAGYSGVDVEQMVYFRTNSLARLKHHRRAVDDIVREYDGVYSQFIAHPEAAANFVNFLYRSREIYWRMGESLSALDHGMHCWEVGTAKFANRRPPAEQLSQVLACLARILGEQLPGEGANRGNFVLA
jgi:hypothetical protein